MFLAYGGVNNNMLELETILNTKLHSVFTHMEEDQENDMEYQEKTFVFFCQPYGCHISVSQPNFK